MPETGPFDDQYRTWLLIIVVTGLGLRLATVGNLRVLTDEGLFVYDSYQILRGQVPMVDYPARSPVFQYLIAGALVVGEDYLLSARLGMVVLSLFVTVAIYLFTAEIHSKRAGLAAAGLFAITPLAITRGIVVKTEIAAQLFVLLGLIPLVRYIDDGLGARHLFATGAMLGLGYLSRKVVLAHLGAVIAFLCYYRFRDRELVRPMQESGVVVLGTFTILVVSYGLMTWPAVDSFVALTKQNLVRLTTGVAWIDPPLETFTNPRSRDSVGRFMRILLASGFISLVSIVPLFVYPYVLVREVDESLANYLLGTLGVLTVAGGSALFVGLDMERTSLFAVPVVVGTLVYLRFTAVPRLDYFREQRLILPVLLIGSVIGGYAYKGHLSILYALDFFPYIAVLAGVALAGVMKDKQLDVHTRDLSIGGLLLASAVVVSMLNISILIPVQEVVNPGTEQPSLADVETVSEEVAGQTTSADQLLVDNPLIALEADRPVVANLSRKMWVLIYSPETTAGQQVRKEVLGGLESGAVSHVVIVSPMDEVLEQNPRINRTFRDQYCRVDTASSQNWSGSYGRVYERRGDDCHGRAAQSGL